eukprot:4802598-Amphidinium_carterae.1
MCLQHTCGGLCGQVQTIPRRRGPLEALSLPTPAGSHECRGNLWVFRDDAPTNGARKNVTTAQGCRLEPKEYDR